MKPSTTYLRLDASNGHLLETAQIFDHRVDPEQLKRFQADAGHELVFAMSEAVVIGFASGTVLRHPDKPPVFFVNEIDVAQVMRRQGVATALCQMLFGIARSKGCEGAWLATENENAAARGVYRALGARETAGIVVFDWDGAMDL